MTVDTIKCYYNRNDMIGDIANDPQKAEQRKHESNCFEREIHLAF